MLNMLPPELKHFLLTFAMPDSACSGNGTFHEFATYYLPAGFSDEKRFHNLYKNTGS